jgi:hypothetical protein
MRTTRTKENSGKNEGPRSKRSCLFVKSNQRFGVVNFFFLVVNVKLLMPRPLPHLLAPTKTRTKKFKAKGPAAGAAAWQGRML